MDVTEILKLIATVASGSLLMYLMQWSLGKRKENRVDFEVILQRLISENDELKKECRQLRTNEQKHEETISGLDRSLIELKHNMQLLESSYLDLPFPMWLKDVKGVMLVLNDAYEKLFLIPNGKKRIDYIGNTDSQVWGEELGSQYWGHDQEVLMSGNVFDGEEKVIVNGIPHQCRIIKYPRYLGRTRIGIGGCAIRSKPY